MTPDLMAFLRFNLILSAVILFVLAIRKPVRKWLGAQQAFAAWYLIYLSLGAIMPARVVFRQAAPVTFSVDAVMTPATAPITHTAVNVETVAILIWFAGMAGLAMLFYRRQRAFDRMVGQATPSPTATDAWIAEGTVGPAVIGLFKPRIILPSDFETRYSAQEQQVILAHERAHIASRDPAMNLAFMTVMQCALWFNPLVHLAAHYRRIDQEMCRDAQVLSDQPSQRQTYAEAMLKTQFTQMPALAAGCYWPTRGADLLKERIAMLKQPATTSRRRALTIAGFSLLYVCGAAGAWASQPPKIVVTPASLAPPTPQQVEQAVAVLSPGQRKLLNACAAAEAKARPGSSISCTVSMRAGTTAAKAAQASGPRNPPAAPTPALVKVSQTTTQANLRSLEIDGLRTQEAQTSANLEDLKTRYRDQHPQVVMAQAQLGALQSRLNALGQVTTGNSVVREYRPPAPRPAIVTNPDWLSKPTAEEVAHAYPEHAARMEKTGRATLRCSVAADGGLDSCAVASEAPEGYGFGASALALAPRFKMKPATRDGASVEGAAVTIPIVFSLALDPAPPFP